MRSPLRPFPLALAAVLLAGALAGCGEPPPAESAILITIDTWRGDSFGAGGDPALRTPHIDRLFRHSWQFAEAYSPIPTTLPSHVSMLTGEWPTDHGVPRNIWEVPADLATLPEMLGAKGIASGAFVSSAALDGKTNVGRGFDVFDDRFEKEGDDGWRRAAGTLARASEWWNGTSGRKFLWVHLFEPHLPYAPKREDVLLYATGAPYGSEISIEWIKPYWLDKSRFTEELREHLVSLYHAEITGVDRHLGAFLRAHEGDGRTAVLLTSDHGESLGEHNLYFKHGPKVFRPDVRVPMALRAPGVSPGVSDGIVRTIDVPRTLLTLLDVDATLPVDADNLLERRRGHELTSFSVASAEFDAPEFIRPRDGYENRLMPRAIRRADTTFVETPWADKRVWFDRAADPDERHELRPDYDAGMSEMREELDAWMANPRVTSSAFELDPELRERMRALGYLD
ncbi:sulfatase [bacterium]|nr:sulfatase [bacterium]